MVSRVNDEKKRLPISMKYFSIPTNSLVRQLLISGVAIVVIAVMLIIALYYYINAPLTNIQAPARFEIAAGSSLSRVSQDLSEAGYINYPQVFNLWAKLTGVEEAIKTGEYELRAGLSKRQLLDKLVIGDTLQYKLTLVEGWSFSQALNAIWSSEKVVANLKVTPLSEVSSLLGHSSDNPEGLLFPDTYFYTAGTTDLELLQRANARLSAILNTSWESRLGALPYEDSYQALTMASIIEKESAIGSERGHIAGVFVRRLEYGMRLQSDPTVIYGMGNNYNGNIRRQDLLMDTAYNTYRIDGLPPTPIAMAGLDSIHAALNPLPGEYLYFVATGDGSHYFSTTLAEHNDAVRRFQTQGTVR
ncbi:MAG: endolytic transglycosylase MltG [Gammaproteobacteria bacterium]|nr:endolytic transglycosylase MltG [Gammaproteobacteria bacterium]